MSQIQKIKKLREITGVSNAHCNKAITESKGNIEKAQELLKIWGVELAAKKAGTRTNEGVIESYIHHNKRMGAIVKLHCETDFVAQNAEFRKLATEIAMQIASMGAKTPEELLNQAYIRDPGKTVGDLIKEHIVKLGENIQVGEFTRLGLDA